MNKRQINYWYNIYKTSLRGFDIEMKDLKNPTEKSLERAKKKWKEATQELEDKPTVREAYKAQVAFEKEQAEWEEQQRDENYRTETATDMHDTSLEEIQDFIDKINAIYEDTLSEITRAENNEKGVDGLFAIGASYKNYIAGTHDELIEFLMQIQAMASEYPDEVALFIASSPELDYTYGIYLVPPSDIESNFEITTQTLRAIWRTIQADMREQGKEVPNIATSFGE